MLLKRERPHKKRSTKRYVPCSFFADRFTKLKVCFLPKEFCFYPKGICLMSEEFYFLPERICFLSERVWKINFVFQFIINSVNFRKMLCESKISEKRKVKRSPFITCDLFTSYLFRIVLYFTKFAL